MNREGTLVVLAFVAKQDNLFKANDVFEETGLERPLVYYHLNRFVEKGYLEKQGNQYIVLDRNALIETLAYGQKGKKVSEATQTLIFKNNAQLNETIRYALQARALTLPGSRDLKDRLNLTIDRTIQSLRDAKRGLNTKSVSPKKATKALKEDDALEQYLLRLDYFGITADKEMIKLTVEMLKEDK